LLIIIHTADGFSAPFVVDMGLASGASELTVETDGSHEVTVVLIPNGFEGRANELTLASDIYPDPESIGFRSRESVFDYSHGKPQTKGHITINDPWLNLQPGYASQDEIIIHVYGCDEAIRLHTIGRGKLNVTGMNYKQDHSQPDWEGMALSFWKITSTEERAKYRFKVTIDAMDIGGVNYMITVMEVKNHIPSSKSVIEISIKSVRGFGNIEIKDGVRVQFNYDARLMVYPWDGNMLLGRLAHVLHRGQIENKPTIPGPNGTPQMIRIFAISGTEGGVVPGALKPAADAKPAKVNAGTSSGKEVRLKLPPEATVKQITDGVETTGKKK